jgi:2-dehydropantoate 2-reductase
MTTATRARVLVFGTGGVGTIAAHALETGRKAAVTVICRSNYAAVIKNGFTIDSIEHGRDIKRFFPSKILNSIPDIEKDSLQPYDYLVITTKNIPDIPPNLPDLIAPAVTPGKTSILLLQNGLNIERPFLQRFPYNTILSGVSLIGATETSPGIVKHDGRDKAYIGVFPHSRIPEISSTESELRARKFVELYNACNAVTWEYDPDVRTWRWKKLVYNAAFSSVAALTGLDTGAMRMSNFIIQELVRPAMLEIVAIAKAAGVMLPEGIHEVFIKIDPAEKRYLPSMGVDAKKGNFLELENIIGEPVREAERLGVPAPTLRILYSLLRGLQLRTKEAKGMWEAKFDDDNPWR